jgi:hypothetical protein
VSDPNSILDQLETPESPYQDLIDQQRPPYPAKYPPMPQAARAAQFASFDALTGYHELLEDVDTTHEEMTEFTIEEE